MPRVPWRSKPADPRYFRSQKSSTTLKELRMADIPVPEIVSAEKWQEERDELLAAEKQATRALDVLAARRRRLPMVRFDNDQYVFDTPDGPKRLLDLFGERR